MAHDVGQHPKSVTAGTGAALDGASRTLSVQVGTQAWCCSRSSSAVATTGEDHRTLLVVGVDELEEQVSATDGDRQITDLVDDQQCGPGVEADAV